ncbi:uncharacterized protein LOC142233803 [Haematobia irritans]|uniref:uncharacterized protein LOC142233803 n=1 Tax=Haematobia irritans TaxID=7368 RepID=UPI003F505BFE
MHFWIDKRSPQCGFGRSRVAASLSGAGGGAGVSFGHPPRRTGGHKSSSAGIHRQQHQQQAQQSTSQYHHHVAASGGNNIVAGGSNACTAGATTISATNSNYRSPNYPSTSGSYSTNNNNNSHGAVTGGVGVGQSTHTPSTRNHNHLRTQNAHHYYNNNRQYHSTNIPNSSNNNHSSTSSTHLTAGPTSPTGNNLNSSSYATNPAQMSSTLSAVQTSSHHLQQQNPYQQQRYRHPQFGNMSVRTYPTSAVAHQQSTCHTTNSNVQQITQSTDSTLNSLAESTSLQNQSPNQTANISAELYQSSPRVVTVFPRPLSSAATCDHSNSTNSSTTAPNTMRAIYGSSSSSSALHHGNTRRRNVTHSIESADLQFIPYYMKFGIFASFVLAIAFIAGIKVYFDNHGTKFEVGLFWLLTATFVFAFCFVSICKVPRILFATSTTSSRSGSRDQTIRERCSLEDNREPIADASADDAGGLGLHDLQQEMLEQQINQGPQQIQLAGPPPYHIAILLPESKANKEEIEQVEESPPPSYDKILI